MQIIQVQCENFKPLVWMQKKELSVKLESLKALSFSDYTLKQNSRKGTCWFMQLCKAGMKIAN